MEEVAYTWVNRFAALRFMEVNGYLPSHIRVFTDDNNNFKPQILAEAIHLELDGLDMEKVYEMKNKNDLAILLVSHDLELVRKYADKVVLLDKTILCKGSPNEVYEDPNFKRVFGGPAV